MKFLIAVLNFVLFSCGVQDTIASNICGENETLGSAVISVLNLTYPGLETIASFVSRGDLNGACEALAEYYTTSNSTFYLRRPLPPASSRRVGGSVDACVFNDIFNEGSLGSGRVPRNEDGGLDWLYRGPRNDPEFENVLNRHGTFLSVLDAWSATGNDEYVTWIDKTIIDWATHNPCPASDLQKTVAKCYPVGDGSTPICSWVNNTPGSQACVTSYTESPWRLLEQGIRFSSSSLNLSTSPWPATFFGLQQASNFSSSARSLAILVAGEHLLSLLEAGKSGVSNWAITQSTGLVTLALAFPELNKASIAKDTAIENLLSLLQSGVYPDGVETEQASGYDMNTANDFLSVLQLLAIAGDSSPPENFKVAAEKMWSYGAYISDPSGCLPRNGDSDICGSGYSEAATLYFNRSDWMYIHSNGKNGTIPISNSTTGPSVAFPWAGQIVMRSDYSESATWAFFDVGPYGSSIHGHRDKLSLNIHARGAMLLVDSGRFAYSGNDLPAILHVAYARNATAHNTFTIDGCDQAPEPAVATAPLPVDSVFLSPSFDEIYSTMTNYDENCLRGAAKHSRSVRFMRAAGAGGTSQDDGDYLVVVDVVSSDRPRSVQAHWHSHPNASIIDVNTTTGVATIGGARWSDNKPLPVQACVIPATNSSDWDDIKISRGEKPPAMYQGWFSASYDDAIPASTLVYEGNISVSRPGVWAWLIIPSAKTRSCNNDDMQIKSFNTTHVIVDVSLSGHTEIINLEIRFAED
jgi:hypothetical protein